MASHCETRQGLEGWKDSIRLACEWIIKRALINSPEHGLENPGCWFIDRYSDWRGAFKGEYSAATGHWDMFCPIWHGGQGVKALVLAHQVLGESIYLEKAKAVAEFILRNQIQDQTDQDYGLIMAFEEGGSRGVNTSAILESLDGLFLLSAACGDSKYAESAIHALNWVQKRMYIIGEGLFRDEYDPVTRKCTVPRWKRSFQPGRPLLDDGVYLTGYELSGNEEFKTMAVQVADRLLQDECPKGNWKAYGPCHPETGVIHPRHAYWWGRPLLAVHRYTGQAKYLECCKRSADWYVNAMRTDGGFFRDTYPDFNTPTFGHATSGSACAAILWHDLAMELDDETWNQSMKKALDYCRCVQFVHPADPNLEGAVLEKVMHPCYVNDAAPWHLRDISTIFYIQAVCLAIRDMPDVLTS